MRVAKKILPTIALLGAVALVYLYIVRLRSEKEQFEQSNVAMAKERAAFQASRKRSAVPVAERSVVESRGVTAYELEIDRRQRNADKLRQYLASDPSRGIPEMALLSEADWIEIAKDATINDSLDARFYLSQLRAKAKKLYGKLLRDAFLACLSDSKGALPITADALEPYLRASGQAGPLSRYEIVLEGNLLDSDIDNPRVAISEKQSVDSFFDNNLVLLTNGTILLTSANKATDLIGQATRRYARSHNKTLPTSIYDVIPYLEEPVDMTLISKLDEISKRGGK